MHGYRLFTSLARLLLLLSLPIFTAAQSTPEAFGDSIPVSNGLIGKIYLLPDTITRLPDFDTLHAQPTAIYTRSVDIPERDWAAGFPGLRGRFEWFGIEYKGNFRAARSGTYNFRLVSDDGAKLYIDDSLIIDNDGTHATRSASGMVTLDSLSLHSIKLRYFQGPRLRLALQLYWTVADSKEEIFPGNNFILYTPHPSFPWWWLVIAAVLLLLFFVWWKRRKKSRRPTVQHPQPKTSTS